MKKDSKNVDKTESRNFEKLKNFAFQSGYPLENDIEKILSNLKHKGTWSLLRDFNFNALDENDVSKIRSIDFVCSIEYSKIMLAASTQRHELQARLHFVIESKWIDKDSQWWMIPRSTPNFRAEIFPYLVPKLDRCVNRYEKPLRSASLVGQSYGIAQSGRKVSIIGSSENASRESLNSYQTQLIQGTTAFLEERAKWWQNSNLNDYTGISPLEIVIPIIATNAPIQLLHFDITSNKILSAEKEEDIFHPKGCLQLEFPTQKQLIDSTKNSILNFCNNSRLNFLNPFEDLPLMPTLICSTEYLPTLIQSRVEVFERAFDQCRNEIYDIPI